MTSLRKPNEKVAFNQHYSDIALANVDPAITKIVEASQRWDKEAEAQADAHYERQMRANQEIQDANGALAQLERQRERPNHTKQTLADLEARITAQRAKVDRLMARAKETKAAAPMNFVARMETSRKLKVIEKAGFRPHRLIKVDLPKVYAATDTLSAIATVREHIAELHALENGIAKAYLPRDDAHKRMHNAIRRKAEDAKTIPVGEVAVARRTENGDFHYGPFEMPMAGFWEAMIPTVVAHFADRIDAHYDKMEENFEVEFLSLEDRRREMRELKTRCDELERIEGALLRKAYMEGHEPAVRPDMDPANLFPLEIDDSVEWEAPPSGEMEFFNARKKKAQAV